MREVSRMSEVSHHCLMIVKKIDRDFSTLWLEKPPSILSTTITDLEFTLNDC